MSKSRSHYRDRHIISIRLRTAWAILSLFACTGVSNALSMHVATGVDSSEASSLSECAKLLKLDKLADAKIASANSDYLQSTTQRNREIKALLQLAGTLQELGDYRNAATNLETALALAQPHPDKVFIATIIGALGNVHIALGPPEVAEQCLTEAVFLAEQTKALELKAVVQNNLGNHYGLQESYEKALAAYTSSARLAESLANSELAARAHANAARIALKAGELTKAETLSEQAITQASAVADSHEKAYLLINVARTLNRLDKHFPLSQPPLTLRSHQLLSEANEVAGRASDPLAASYALGYLGELYEGQRRYREALDLTRRALFQGQQVNENSSLYLWYWQLGRLFEALDDQAAAIDAYTRAVDLLKELRFQMAVNYGAPGASFRESVGPVYERLVGLLLKDAAESRDAGSVERLLQQARGTVEQLKAAELRDYFQDNCVDALQAKRKHIDEISSSAVVVYPIVLKDRTELLLSFPGGSLKRYPVPVSSTALQEEVRKFRRLLEKRTTNQFRPHARRLHEWLIEPFQSDLSTKEIDTLVFVPDGVLRTIPMAALYDGRRYLIEKYAVAVTPGLELTDPSPLDRQRLTAVFGGLSKSVRGFPALAYVPQELQSIQQSYGGTLLLDEDFLLDRLQESLQDDQLNVLHIATHAQFKGDANESFLLTYDGQLTINQLAEYVGLFKFRETPLELLVLSACETAHGDERAALGLSGVAIKAGARSALGALWKVNDVATSRLISDFYEQLKDPTVSRAVALQSAQRNLIDDLSYRHPGYWSAFLLLNSWL